MSKYAKFWAALIIGVVMDALVTVQVALEGGITASEWMTVAIVVIGSLGAALGVYQTRNAPMDE